MEPIAYEEMTSGEELAVCVLVKQVFDELVAPDYCQRGVDEFYRFVNPTAVAERVRSGGHVLVAKKSEKIVGVLEFVPPDRIALLFVTLRGQGIGKELVTRIIDKAKYENPSLSKVTVHSSPYAKAAYQKMGFRQSGDATTEHGIQFIPMELGIED